MREKWQEAGVPQTSKFGLEITITITDPAPLNTEQTRPAKKSLKGSQTALGMIFSLSENMKHSS